ncbi:type II toxin-antitoxin system VapC family toxin [Aestuariivirga sp.]|uniref:type II toxin-antitoxin system VapC family toxin n=1 Tax=Aestuariivirga sp. TaxID=2650926 RepID=UPI0039E35387
MILADTSVWIDHFRKGDARLASLLLASEVLVHPLIIGEIALGQLKARTTILASLGNLQSATVATDREVLDFISSASLGGSGIGYLDAHLLASVVLTSGAKFWTRDRKLASAAARLGLAA